MNYKKKTMKKNKSLLLGSYANELHKVVNIANGGETYVNLPSSHTYFDYKTQKTEVIIDKEDIDDVNFSVFTYGKTKKKQQQQKLPTKATIMKLKNNDIVLYIPNTELIKITREESID